MNNITLDQISEMLTKAHTVVILSHTSPDGDTVGATVALADALNDRGIHVHALCDVDIHEYLDFVSGGFYEKDTDDSGLIVALDVASKGQLGALAEKFGDRIDIRIDHHDLGEDFAKYNYCIPNAAATCEIMYELLRKMDALTKNAATALYTGISTDSGSFRYSNTTPNTLRVAAALIEAGADAETINEKLYEDLPLSSLRADGFFLDHMELHENGKILIVKVALDEMESAGLSLADVDGFSSLARKISGVQLGISIREKEPGVYKASMRSRKSIDCAKICASLGGGGHIRAAGATIYAENIENAHRAVLDAACRYLEDNNL